jgi:hypothetical protein
MLSKKVQINDRYDCTLYSVQYCLLADMTVHCMDLYIPSSVLIINYFDLHSCLGSIKSNKGVLTSVKIPQTKVVGAVPPPAPPPTVSCLERIKMSPYRNFFVIFRNRLYATN